VGYVAALTSHYRLTGLEGHAKAVGWGRVGAFAAGITLLGVALLSPLRMLGMHYLLTAHMAQHMLLTVVCPPLLLLGTPRWILTPFLRRPTVRRVTRGLLHPVVVFGLFNLTVWLWHLPALFDAVPPTWSITAMLLLDNALVLAGLLFVALVVLPWLVRLAGGRASSRLEMSAAVLAIGVVVAVALGGWLNVGTWPAASQPHNPLHTLMEALFFSTALLYWWPILSPVPELAPRLSPLAGVLYLFVSTQPMMALGALLVFASQPLYQTYVHAPLLWGFTRLGDQQLGGLIMWLPMDIPLFIGISVLFFRWVNQQDRLERLRAGEGEGTMWDIEASEPDSLVR
jgi:cytochrome c oxidase assembly factor CtaG